MRAMRERVRGHTRRIRVRAQTHDARARTGGEEVNVHVAQHVYYAAMRRSTRRRLLILCVAGRKARVMHRNTSIARALCALHGHFGLHYGATKVLHAAPR